MSCISAGNKRCSKCCEAIHIPHSVHRNMRRGVVNYTDQSFILKYWKPVSKRVAKKINPYIFQRPTKNNEYLSSAQFFICKSLVDGVCSEYKNRPDVCRRYSGGLEYSPTCLTDIKIIARS